MQTDSSAEVVHQSLLKLEAWVQAAGWKAYDTFDGLSSPYARFFTWNIPLLKQIWQQGVRRFPLNLRPLLAIKPGMSTKGMGFFAQGYLRLYQATNNPAYLEKMKFCLQWLMENCCSGYKGLCWGNHFDYQHRAGRIPKGMPTIVWTGLIGHAFLDAYEALHEKRYLYVAEQVSNFIAHEIGHTEFEEGVHLHYYPGATHCVHNSSMIGASLLARAHHFSPHLNVMELSKKTVHWTMQHQLENGAWYYGVGPKFQWIDSFHTAYVLEALDTYNRYAEDTQYGANLEKGYKYYLNTFFEADGTPRYYDCKKRPLDIQCASQAIQTCINLRRLHPDSVGIAQKVAHWTIAKMQDSNGYFYYRKYPFITNKTPTLHWGQATMFAALALLYQHLTNKVLTN